MLSANTVRSWLTLQMYIQVQPGSPLWGCIKGRQQLGSETQSNSNTPPWVQFSQRLLVLLLSPGILSTHSSARPTPRSAQRLRRTMKPCKFQCFNTWGKLTGTFPASSVAAKGDKALIASQDIIMPNVLPYLHSGGGAIMPLSLKGSGMSFQAIVL